MPGIHGTTTSGSRRGTTLVELSIAVAILGIAAVSLVQFIGVSARQRRLSHQRQIALQELANESERVALTAWDEVTADKLTTWQALETLSVALPSAVCSAVVSDETGPPVSRRVRLSISWQDSTGQELTPVELTLWKFPPEGQP